MKIRHFDGLSLEQIHQVSLDYTHADDAQNELARLHGKNIEDFESMQLTINRYQLAEREYSQIQTDSEELREYFGPVSFRRESDEPTEEKPQFRSIGQLCVEASSTQLLRTGKAFRERTASLQRQGDNLSRLIVNELTARLPDLQEARIDGWDYSWPYGFLMKHSRDRNHRLRFVLFAYPETVKDFSHEYSKAKRQKVWCRVANTNDWQSLLHGICRISQL